MQRFIPAPVKDEDRPVSFLSKLGALALAGILGLALSLVVCLLFAVIVAVSNLGEYKEWYYPAAVVGGITGSFLAGFIAAGKSDRAGIVSGLLAGAFYFFLLLVFGVFVTFGAPSLGVWFIILLFLSLVFGGIGGIVSVNRRSRRN